MMWLAGWAATIAAAAGPALGPALGPGAAGGPERAGHATTGAAFAVVSPLFAAETTLPADVPADRWFAEDKAQHFVMSFAATSMAYGVARLTLEPQPARSGAAGAAVALGIGKELWDVRRGGPFSLKDLAWDALGVALGLTLVQRID